MRIAWLMCAFGVALSLTVASSRAQAQVPLVYSGNDTGGIIPWSCETEALAPEIAADFCARWDKYPRITSVHRQYGDYIAFRCLWSPHVDRYALPAVPTRNTCLPARIITK
jgi:hypothetical protein